MITQDQGGKQITGHVKLGNMIKLADILNEAKKEKDTFEDFAETRGKGAAKIADNAEEKGGLALLTWHPSL